MIKAESTRLISLRLDSYNSQIETVTNLPYAPHPLFFKQQVTRAGSRWKSQEIDQQPVEFTTLIQHGEMTGLFKDNCMGLFGQTDLIIQAGQLNCRVILPVYQQAGHR